MQGVVVKDVGRWCFSAPAFCQDHESLHGRSALGVRLVATSGLPKGNRNRSAKIHFREGTGMRREARGEPLESEFR